MSVTLTISGNREHCYQANRVGYVEYPCQQCEFYPEEAATCRECGGLGKVRFEELPFELNLANSNFRTFFAALGLEPGEYLSGSSLAQPILNALRSFDPELAVRGSVEETGKGGCRVYDMGIDQDQVARYVRSLTEIAEEAARREEWIVWA